MRGVQFQLMEFIEKWDFMVCFLFFNDLNIYIIFLTVSQVDEYR
jgi:hypothetical protein